MSQVSGDLRGASSGSAVDVQAIKDATRAAINAGATGIWPHAGKWLDYLGDHLSWGPACAVGGNDTAGPAPRSEFLTSRYSFRSKLSSRCFPIFVYD